MLLIRKFLSDSSVQKHYIRAGAEFGSAVCYLFMGEAIGFDRLHSRWESWEDEYAHRGYRTISLDKFIVGYGGYGVSIDNLIGEKREEGEELILHAKIYREKFLGKGIPMVRRSVGDNGAFVEEYVLPSTEAVVENNNQE